jgi:hypothetical protein
VDTDSELARAKWLLFSGAFFLASCFICWGELAYLLRGRRTDATVTKAYEVTRRGRFGIGSSTALTVEYAFAEPDGTRRTGSDTVPPDWDLPPNGKAPVQYTPGEDGRSRLAGHVHWAGLAIFAVSVVVLGFFGYRLWREASEATRPARPRRRP